MSADTIAKNLPPGATSPGSFSPETHFDPNSEPRHEAEVWLTTQKNAFRAAMNGEPLEVSLNILITTTIKLYGNEARCAFYLADSAREGLHHVTGMPESYARHIDGFKIGPESLACGLAVHRGQPLITPDVREEPLWKPFLWLAEQYGYRACWSFPVETSAGELVGSFTLYFKEPRDATSGDLKRAAVVTQNAAIIISRNREAEERARAEKGLRQSEAQLRALVDATSDIVYRMSPDWSEVRDSKGMRLSEHKAPVLDWLKRHIPVDDHARVMAAALDAIRNKATFELEHPFLRSDGSVRWIFSRAVPLLDERSEIIEWLGAASDITARKQAEEELRASEERYRLASEAGNVGVFEFDTDGQVAYVSPQVCKIFGIAQSDQMDLSVLRNARHPDDSDTVDEAVVRAAAGDGRLDIEYRILRPDGTMRWVRVTRVLVEASTITKRTRIVGTIRDITDRKLVEEELRRSNERLKLTLETDAVGVLFFKHGGTLIGANDEFLKMAGYSRAEVESGELNWRMMTPPEWIAGSEAQVAKFAETGRIGPYEKEFICKDGSRRWMLFAGRDLGDGTICEYCIDVTERKRTEEALRKADERFRAITNAAPVLIWESDINDVIFGNQQYFDFFGVDLEALRSRKWAQLLHPDDAAGYLEVHSRAFSRREPFSYECRVRRADRQYRWLLITGRPLDEDRFVGFSADITERKEVEDALREADDRFRAMANAVPVMIWETDMSGALFVNEHYLEFLGADLDAVRGMNWVQFLHPDDAPGYLAVRNEAYARREPFSYECRARRADGQYRWMFVTGRPVGENRFVGFCADVTESKQAEEKLREADERFRAMANAAPALIWESDAKGLLFANQQYLDFFGLDFEALRDMKWAQFLHPEDIEGYLAVRNKAFEQREPFTCEHRARRADGEYRWLLVTGRPLGEDRFVGFSADITARKEAEEKLRQADERFRMMANDTPVLIWEGDKTGLVFANQQYLAFFRVGLDELRGMQWIRFLHPQDAEGYRAAVRKAFVHRQPLHYECRIRRADGEYRWMLITGRSLGEDRLVGFCADITERKQAEESLRRADERFRTMANAAPALIWEADLDNVIFANQQYIDFFGVDLDALRERKWMEFVHPDDIASYLAVAVKALEQRVPYTHEVRARRADGPYRWLLVTGRPFGNDTFVGFNVDITERKEAERAWREADERFRTMANAAPVLIWEADAKGLLFCNQQYLDFFGVDFESLRAMGWTRFVPPEDLPRYLAITREALARREPFTYEGHVIRADGQKRWMLVTGRPLSEDLYVGFNVDTTERKQAEQALHQADERFRAMTNAAPVLIWEGDAKGLFFVNQQFLDFFGVDFDALRGMGWAQFMHPDDFEPYVATARRAATHNEPYTYECRLRRGDGQYRWLLVTGRPLGEGRVVGFSADITERKEAEEALREADRKKDEFLALLGHELRNPLAAISTALQVLSRATRSAERAELEKVATDQLTLMQRLLNDLLDIGRFSHGHIELKKESVDLRDLLWGATASVRRVVDDRDQDLRIELPSKSVRFMADRARLDQIIGNLLANASIYTPIGGKIELSGGREGSHVVLRCKDNGQGIEAANLAKIFEPFARGTSTEFGYGEAHLGIGLALAKQLTELHGGTIEAASSGPGLGSEFTVRLPLALPSEDASLPERPAQRTAGSKSHRRSIVMVEDNPNLAKVMRMALEQAGHKVRVFPDGAAALAAGAALSAEAIILDIGLPGMDGYELAAKLKERRRLRGATFIAVSGFKPHEQTAKTASAFDHYLIKPIDVHALLALLDAPENESQRAKARKSARLRVLLVEDHPGVAVATASLLKREKLEVRTVETGREALDAAPEFRPHLVLCDMNLPDMKGTEVICELKSRLGDDTIRGIIITARSASEIDAYNRNAAKLGVDGFVPKPIERETIRKLRAELKTRPDDSELLN